MANSRLPVVYLPVELLSREFDSKALLAAELAGRGYTVVLGQQWMLFANLDRLPPGIVLFKSFNRIHQGAMRQAREAGHRVVALEEELLAQVEERAVTAMCTEGIFDAADLILCNGRFEHEILARHALGKSRLEITGNGRIDLLKPAHRAYFSAAAEEIRHKHGEFVLINTNFSILNSLWQSLEQVTQIQVQAGFVRPDDPQSIRTWQDYVDFEQANRDAMHAAIRELARRRLGEKIIVRPHPGEELARWDGLFKDLPNVAVIREGSHVPWTLACRVLLHTSCTTGFEAHVAGKPALSLVPRPSWITGSLISNQVNPMFHDASSLVDATCRILDGGAAPPAQPGALPVDNYIWNYRANQATARIADLLVEGLPAPAEVSLPPLKEVNRDERLKSKFSLSLEQCEATFDRVAQAFGGKRPAVQVLGDSLWRVGLQKVAVAAALPDHARLRKLIEAACQNGKFQLAYDCFKQNFGEAHRHGDLCFFAGVALFELGRHALALQYFQSAAVADNAMDWNVACWLARTHHRLGEMEFARRYAEQAYAQMPMDQVSFDLFKELALRTGKEVPEHWLVIGCSHVRYFRHLQLNRAKFFGGKVHLECHEFGGATAYGLGSAVSQSGALNATRQLRGRIQQADRVVIQFGEIDCRRAAWKASATSGRPIEETIGESRERLVDYVSREILPYNKSVLLLGAKPQIIADDDFHKNALVDERVVFKPLAERERVTLLFNAQLREAAGRLGVDYVDLDHVLADEKSRRQFFKKVFWDSYTDDTHGNPDYLATLYFQRLQEFV